MNKAILFPVSIISVITLFLSCSANAPLNTIPDILNFNNTVTTDTIDGEDTVITPSGSDPETAASAGTCYIFSPEADLFSFIY